MIHVKVLDKNVGLLKDLLVCFLASIAMGILSKIYIPLFFSPVPITLQTAMVFFLSAYLGARRASFTILLYLLEGLLGCPVFASGFYGIAAFLRPSAGYLIGFLVSSYVVGKFLEKNILRTTAAFLVGNGIIYLFGLTYLSCFIGWKMAIIGGLLPFIPGDLIKIFATVKFLEKFGIYSK
jgi:biotin transport system substrate-specific component